MTTPAVSKRLTQVEARLGTALVTRTTRRMGLTPEGEVYLENARKILGAQGAGGRGLSARAAAAGYLPHFPFPMRCEDIASNADFRRLSTLHGIAVDLRYAGTDNFVGRDLYGSLDCAWLHHLAAAGLERAVTRLAREAPGHRLLVLDALRPHRVQILLWDYLEGTDLRQYVADPALGSIHSFGMALDATLVDPQGRELDMGTGFDAMVELSHPQLEEKHLATGALTPAQHRNRKLLRHVLGSGGFHGIANEWWHFELLDRQHVRQHFTRVD